MSILHISDGSWIDNEKIDVHLNLKSSHKMYLITNTQQLRLTPTFAQKFIFIMVNVEIHVKFISTNYMKIHYYHNLIVVIFFPLFSCN
jgi:hypothetical protein